MMFTENLVYSHSSTDRANMVARNKGSSESTGQGLSHGEGSEVKTSQLREVDSPELICRVVEEIDDTDVSSLYKMYGIFGKSLMFKEVIVGKLKRSMVTRLPKHKGMFSLNGRYRYSQASRKRVKFRIFRVNVKPQELEPRENVGQVFSGNQDDFNHRLQQFQQMQADWSQREVDLQNQINAQRQREIDLQDEVNQLKAGGTSLSPTGPANDPMQVDERLKTLQDITTRPKINIKIDLFDPNKEKSDVDDFMMRFEYSCIFNNIDTDELKIGYFPMYLSTTVQLKVLRWLQTPHTWEGFKNRFIMEYRDHNALNKVMTAINSLSQTTQDSKYKSVKSLYDEYEELIHKLVLYGGAGELPSEQKKIHTYVLALKKEIQLHVIEHVPQPMTLHDAFVIAKSKEDAIERRRLVFGNNNPGNNKEKPRNGDQRPINPHHGGHKQPEKPRSFSAPPNRQQQHRDTPKPVVCWHCEKEGHKKSECPDLKDKVNVISRAAPKSIWLSCKVDKSFLNGMVDSGSSLSLISLQKVKEMGLVRQMVSCRKSFTVANGQTVDFDQEIALRVQFGSHTYNHTFAVWTNNEYPLLLGLDVLNRFEYFSVKHMHVMAGTDKIPMFANGSAEHVLYVSEQTMEEEVVTLHNFQNEHFTKEDIQVGSEGIRTEVYDFLCQYPECFSGPLGCSVEEEHVIDTEGVPVGKRMHNASHHQRKFISKEIEDLEAQGVIRKCGATEFAAGIVLTDKPGSSDEFRFCTDYRALNKITKTDNYPFPRLDVILASFGGKRRFSKIDLRKGYMQIRIRQKDIHKTAFISHQGCYVYIMMPFGLKNAGKTFQRIMDRLFMDLVAKNVVTVYQDDIVIKTYSDEEHWEVLKEVFSRLKKFNFKTNPKKCSFFYDNTKYVGFAINQDGVVPDPERTAGIDLMDIPLDVKQVQTFLGTLSFYRQHIEQFADIAAPLYALLKKGAVFKMGEQGVEAFNKLKEKIKQPILLYHADLEKPFEIHTDASGVAISCILKQNGQTVAVYSRGLKKHELNWAVREKELFAIVVACQKFHYFIDGRTDTVVKSDHHSLTYLDTMPLSGRVGRWAMALMPYNLIIKYIKGVDNKEADHFSRLNGYLENKVMAVTRKTAKKVQFTDTNHELVMTVDDLQHLHSELSHIGGEKLYEYCQGRNIKCTMQQCHDISKSCMICRTTKVGIPKVHKAQELDYGGYPFHTVGMDVVGPLTPCEKGDSVYQYLLVMIDYFSKWVEIIPLTTVTAAETYHMVFQEWICKYGRPYQIITDLGTNFDALKFKEDCRKANIDLHFTSAGYKEGNGVAERLNRTIMDYLRAVVKEKGANNWVDVVPDVSQVLRFSKHSSTKAVPYEVLFGLPANWGPINNAVQLVDLKKRWNQISTSVAYNNDYVRTKFQTSKHETSEKIKGGTRVFVPNTKRENKLDDPFVGPYRVVEVLPYGNLLLDNGSRVNQNQCRIFSGKTESTGGVSEDSDSLAELGQLLVMKLEFMTKPTIGSRGQSWPLKEMKDPGSVRSWKLNK